MADQIQLINNGETAADIRRKINGNTTIINNNVVQISNQVTNVTNSITQVTEQVTNINNTVNETTNNITEVIEVVDKKQDLVVGAATTILNEDLEKNKVLVSNETGKIGISNVTALELNSLTGIKGGIQGQLDNIPKYNYLRGVEITLNDDDTPNSVDEQIIQLLSTTYISPNKWDSVIVAITFIPSDIKKDAQYYYNGIDWIFQNYVSTGINRSNGLFAGIVESSDDIEFNNGQGQVKQADKLKKTLTIGNKSFNGSTNEEVLLSDLMENKTDIDTIRLENKILKLNAISLAKLLFNGDTLILDGGTAKG